MGHSEISGRSNPTIVLDPASSPENSPVNNFNEEVIRSKEPKEAKLEQVLYEDGEDDFDNEFNDRLEDGQIEEDLNSFHTNTDINDADSNAICEQVIPVF